MSSSPPSSSRCHISSSGSSEWAASSIAAWRSPTSAKRAGIVATVKSSGRTLGQLVPLERSGHRRAGLGPHAVGGRDRAVAGVLVVVDEHALAALLLPPLRRHLARQPAFELAAERDRGVADVGEGPARLDPHVDVDAAPAGGLGEADVAQVVEQLPRLRRRRGPRPRSPSRAGGRGRGAARRGGPRRPRAPATDGT